MRERSGGIARVIFALAFLLGALLLAGGPALAQGLPEKFADDPVAKALGPEVFNAAVKEGKVTWYGSTFLGRFLDKGGRKAFESRFGVKIDWVSGQLSTLTDRLRTEISVGRVAADIFLGNDQYLAELHPLGGFVKWRPPAPELDRMSPVSFATDPEGYWWPVQLSTQALLVNTDMVKPGEITSYKDLLDPKWKGKIGTRDPREAAGAGWQFLHISLQPDLGLDYIKKLKEITEPIFYEGGTLAVRDAMIRGQFAISFGGRGEFMYNLPKGAKIAYVVPKEGLTWTPSSIAILAKGPHPNAAKLLETWFYELPQLQLWQTDASSGVPNPDVTSPVPEMSATNYPLMARVPNKLLDDPEPFFQQMEQVFGVR